MKRHGFIDDKAAIRLLEDHCELTGRINDGGSGKGVRIRCQNVDSKPMSNGWCDGVERLGMHGEFANPHLGQRSKSSPCFRTGADHGAVGQSVVTPHGFSEGGDYPAHTGTKSVGPGQGPRKSQCVGETYGAGQAVPQFCCANGLRVMFRIDDDSGPSCAHPVGSKRESFFEAIDPLHSIDHPGRFEQGFPNRIVANQ